MHYPRGSEWRRWDLHIHAPGTALNDQFDSWEEYLATLESADAAVAVLGITDYLSLRGYKRVIAERAGGRLRGIALVIPNLEFRLTPVTKAGKAINLHVLVSPDDPDHVSRVESALGELSIERSGDRIPCTEIGLRRLGVLSRPEVSGDAEAAYREGVNQFKVAFDVFQQWWNSQPWLRRNALIAVANSSLDGASGLQEDSGLKELRAEIYRLSHVILSGRPADREFFLGRSHADPGIGLPKPCLHGSDAHDIAHLLRPAEDRYCWIKADPTFEGLRQTLYEPEDRVFIGVSPPISDAANTLEMLTINDPNGWFGTQKVPLNPGLTAVIGLKGSGKTALTDLVAFAAGADPDPESSFLERAGAHLQGLQIELAWGDGSSDSVVLPDRPWQVEPRVKYLSQQFVERMCGSGELSDELRQEVEAVIFGHVPEDQLMGAASFSELRELKTSSLKERRGEIGEEIARLSHVIADLDLRRQGLDGKKRRQAEIKRSIEGVVKSRPVVKDKAVEAKVKLLEIARSAHAKLVEQVSQRRRMQQAGDDLKRNLSAKIQEFQVYWADLKAKLAAAGLTEEQVSALAPVLPSDLSAFDVRRKALDAEILALSGETGKGPPPGEEPKTVEAWTVRIKELEAVTTLDEQQKKRLLQSLAQEATLRKELVQVDAEIEWALTKYPTERSSARDRREASYLEFFGLLDEESAILRELYGPLRESLAAQGEHEKRLELICEVHADVEGWLERGEELFDLRRQGPLSAGALQDCVRTKLLPAWLSCSRDAIREAFQAVLSLIKDSEVRTAHLRAGHTLLDVAQWLFSVDHITIAYGIQYDGRDLRLLSPGSKGIVLLILYLAADRIDRRPLIVDQPDENLDNQSVYEILRGYFRAAKSRRQVVIITHNPNLVVNTDAEEVVVAEATVQASGLPSITYSSGALEGVLAPGSATVRGEVCRILEGGTEAFNRRERRYREKL